MYRLLSLFVVLAVMINNNHAGNFLLLPFPITSHCLEMAGIARELLKRNHSVFTYLPDTFKTSSCFDGSKVEIITFKPNKEFLKHKDAIDTHILETIYAGKQFMHNLTFLTTFFRIGAPLCESALMATEKIKLLKSKNIDIAIIDSMPQSDCFFYLAKFLNVKTVTEGSVIFPGLGTAVQTHTHPFELSSFPCRMSLPERVVNTLLTLGVVLLGRVSRRINTLDKVKLRNYVPEEVLDADFDEIVGKSLLFIENTNDILDYPKALYPNHIQAGGLTTRPANKLPADLDEFFSQAKKGVIVVSFGSMLSKAPKPFDDRVVSLFQNFEQKVVMVYRENKMLGNVKTVKWLPQNEALAHKNTVLFISHCGKNGFNEALYHGVPIVCTPFQSEQASNGQKAINLNIGSSVELMTSTNEEVVKVIKTVLSNETMRANMKRLSAIFHDAKFNPQETAVNALEHVLKFGGDHLRPASCDLNVFSQYMIDVWLIIFTFVFISWYLAFKIMSCCCRRICCRKRKINKKTKKE